MYNKLAIWLILFGLVLVTIETSVAKSNVFFQSQTYKINPIFEKALHTNKINYQTEDKIAMRILSEYGAVFVSQNGTTSPPYIIFPDENSVNKWQGSVKTEEKKIGNILVKLQFPAMKALEAAQAEAHQLKISISPNGTTASTRSYAETAKLWRSRVDPALAFHIKQKHITSAEAEVIKKLSPSEQIPEILKLEDKGYFFSKTLDKSILYSVAAVGTSQHISMLALDVEEHSSAQVRALLARYGWFQTVVSDQPHFTYLGVTEDKLPSLGLKKVTNQGRVYWLPDIQVVNK